MADSIKNEIEQLESVGRVSARGQRPVHAEFGFSEMRRKKQPAAPPEGSPPLSDQLDDAFARLKASSPAE